MLVKLDQPKLLSDVIGIISELVTEVRLNFNSRGLSIIAIDPANVALISFSLPASAFSQYEAEEEKLGVSLDSLKSVLRRSGIGSSIILKTEGNQLKIEIHDKIKRNFSLALIEIEGEEKEAPSLNFSSKVEMSSMDFLDSVEDCSIVADSCSFIVKDDKFVIEASGLHSARSEFSSDEASISGKGKSRFSLEYLQKFSKACKLSDKVIINLGEDYPLKLEFKSGNVELMFVLAPRVEAED